MLSINLTLFAQMIHFFIAWFLFDRLFLRAAYAYVIQTKKLQQKIEKEQAMQQEMLEDKRQWFHALQQEHGQSLFSLLPDLQRPSLNFLRHRPRISCELSESQKKALRASYIQKIEQHLAQDKS